MAKFRRRGPGGVKGARDGQNFPVVLYLYLYLSFSTSVKLTLQYLLIHAGRKCRMRNERSIACCGPWPDKTGSGFGPNSPFAVGIIFSIGAPSATSIPPYLAGHGLAHFHITFLVWKILDRTLRILDKVPMPLFKMRRQKLPCRRAEVAGGLHCGSCGFRHDVNQTVVGSSLERNDTKLGRR